MSLNASLLCMALVACGGGDGVQAVGDPVSVDGSGVSGGGGGGGAGGGAGSGSGSSAGTAKVAPAAADPNPPRASTLPPGHVGLGLPLETLQRLSRPFGTAHEAIPAGVPPGYDWRERSKRDGGHTVPAGFTAFTGWAQAFWIDGAAAGTQRLELRGMQTLLCSQTGTSPSDTARRWLRLQQGDLEGASFRADFAGGENVPAEAVAVGSQHWRIGFGAGRAYHFWPRQGRALLGSGTLCGVLVLFEARAVAPDGSALPPGAPATLLAGGGADYWLDTRAPWDSYRTNVGVGVGQLHRVGPQWAWHGMGTADAEALAQLARDGYLDRSTP